jgi:ubiquinone/menaquinone biosynthesis C-methylase UbiE
VKHFDIVAPIYNHLFGNYLPVDRWIKLLRLPTQGKLLDAAGGTGRVSIHLTDFVERVFVVDLSSGMLSQTQRKKKMVAIRSNVALLPFMPCSFERIIMVDAFHHVGDQQRTIEDLWRVLKKGGILLIEEPDIKVMGVKFVALLEKILMMRSHFVTREEIIRLFQPFNPHIESQRENGIMWIQVTKTI